MFVLKHIQRAEQLINTRRHDMAMKELQAAIALEPDNITALRLITVCYYDMGKYDLSLESALRLLSKLPDDADTYYLLALNYFQLDNKKSAFYNIAEAIRIDPKNAEYWGVQAALYAKQNDWLKVLDNAKMGLECDPEDSKCLNLRNLSLTKLGRTGELNDGIAESLSAHPDDAHTHATIGWAKLETRNHKEARIHFAEALRLEPHNNWAREGMIEALKANNIIYRWFLAYFFWISKRKNKTQWGIILVVYSGTRLLNTFARTYPVLYIPYVIIAIATYLTWIIDPFFNIMVYFDRYGRYLLNQREKSGAGIVGSGIALALAAVAAFFLTDIELFIFCALYFASVVIPFAQYFGMDEDSRGLKKVGIFTLSLAIAGAVALFIIAAGFTGGFLVGLFYLFGIWSFGWVANYLNTR